MKALAMQYELMLWPGQFRLCLRFLLSYTTFLIWFALGPNEQHNSNQSTATAITSANPMYIHHTRLRNVCNNTIVSDLRPPSTYSWLSRTEHTLTEGSGKWLSSALLTALGTVSSCTDPEASKEPPAKPPPMSKMCISKPRAAPWSKTCRLARKYEWSHHVALAKPQANTAACEL